MTGRIEGILKDLQKRLGDIADEWISKNYIETLSHYPKAVLREKLLSNLRLILDRHRPEDFGYAVQDYMTYKRDVDGNWRHTPFNYIDFAKELTMQINWDLQQRRVPINPEDELAVLNMASSYGVRLFGNESAMIAEKVRKLSGDFDTNLRNTIIATFVAGKDVNLINHIVALGINHDHTTNLDDLRHDAYRLSVGRIPFYPDIDDVVERLETLRNVDEIIRRLLLTAKEHGKTMPDDLYAVAYEIHNNILEIEKAPYPLNECIWNYYLNSFTHQEHSKMNVGNINPVQIIAGQSEIADMVVQLLKDSAIEVKPMEVFEHVCNMAHSGIISPRGVELAVRARWAEKISCNERQNLWVEAVIWSMSMHQNPLYVACGKKYQSQMAYILHKLAQYVFPGMPVFGHTADTVYGLIKRVEISEEIDEAINQLNRDLKDGRVDGLMRMSLTEKLLDCWDEFKAIPGDMSRKLVNYIQSDVDMLFFPKFGVEEETETEEVVQDTVDTSVVYLRQLEDTVYRFTRNEDDEFVIAREYGIHPENGQPLHGMWVIRNYHTGEFIDCGRVRATLFERNNLHIPE